MPLRDPCLLSLGLEEQKIGSLQLAFLVTLTSILAERVVYRNLQTHRRALWIVSPTIGTRGGRTVDQPLDRTAPAYNVLATVDMAKSQLPLVGNRARLARIDALAVGVSDPDGISTDRTFYAGEGMGIGGSYPLYKIGKVARRGPCLLGRARVVCPGPRGGRGLIACRRTGRAHCGRV